MAADSPVAGGPDEGHGPGEGRGRRRGLRLWNLLKAAVHLALAALVIGVSAFFFLTRSGPGQRWVVDEVLQRVAGGLRGRVTIEELWSANLLEGVSLRGVSIVGPDGRPFLEVDSLRARYSALQLVAGPLVFSDVTVYRPRVRIATLPGEERSNLDVIFGPLTDPAGSSAGEAGEGQRGAAAEGVAAPEGGPVPGESAAGATDSARARTDGAPREIVLRDVRLVDASLEYLEPLGDEDTGRVVVVEAPGGGRLRRIEVGNVQARLPRAVLSSPDFEGVVVDVASLALDARIFRDPLRVEELRGRLRWVDGTFSLDADGLRLPESVLTGTAVAETGGEEGTVLTLDLSASPLVLADVAWVEPRIPSGTVVGGIGLVVAPGLLEGTFRDADATLGDDRIRADGGVALAETGVRFAEMDLRLEPLDLDRLRPWSEAEIPLEGRLEGSLNLDGPLRSLRTRGRLALTPPGAQDATTRVTLEGVLRVGSDPGATDLVATFDPLDYRTLARLLADSTAFGGVGSATVEATGALSDGVRFTAEAVHREGALPPSHLMVRGSVRRANGAMVLDIQGDVSPLSVTSLRSYAPNLPVTGEVSGSIRARGPLSDLTLTAMLDTEAGRLDLESRFDALDPGRSYRVEGTIEDVPLGRFVPNLPEPSRVSGEVFVEGSGLSPESARASGRLTLRPSTVAGIDVDTLELSFQV
ncbi:MAG TPA: hypothetical protein VLL48_09240, partial [Longimicrobiales bacterium]|nr:hypothetical protein [Longimicrobiales bacterium]